MSPEGKPIQVNASALQAASAQNTMGMLKMKIDKTANFQELSINCEGKFLLIKSQRWYKATLIYDADLMKFHIGTQFPEFKYLNFDAF